MKPYPFSNFISSLYGFIYSTAKPQLVGIHAGNLRLPFEAGKISDVYSSVHAAECSYWDPALKDEINASWLGYDNPKYFALFNRSNSWSYSQFMDYVYSPEYESPDGHCGSIFHGEAESMVPNEWETFSGVTIGRHARESKVKFKSCYTATVGPGGRVRIKCPISRDCSPGTHATLNMVEYIWDPEEDHLDVYYATVDGEWSKCKLGSLGDNCHKNHHQCDMKVWQVLQGIYYSKLIRGEHSRDVMSYYGGSAHGVERRRAVEHFINRYMDISSPRPPEYEPRFIPSIDAKFEMIKASGNAFASSATLHVYKCDNLQKKNFRKVKSIDL